MTLSREQAFLAALVDTEDWHADQTPWSSRRTGTMLRKDPKPRPIYGRDRGMLVPGMSRLQTSKVIGCGSEGLALIVHQVNWLEPIKFRNGEAPRNRTVVKLRNVERVNGKLPLMVLQTVARELVQGLVAAHLHVPFLAGISNWWLWFGEALPPVEPHHVMPHLPPHRCRFDVTDLFDAPTASEIRRRYVRKLHVPLAAGENWDSAYLRIRTEQLKTQQVDQLPLVVIEQPNAGDDTLWDMLIAQRVLVRSAETWRYFSAQIRLIALMVAHLQTEYAWIHGDMSASNIILASGRREMPPTFRQLPPFVLPELRGRLYAPTFIDLSRSALRPSLVESLSPRQPHERRPTFRRDAIAYVDGYAGGTEFSRTADMRRLGLSLCTLIVGQTCGPTPSVSFAQLDARIVRVARLLIDAPAAWAATGDWKAPRTDEHVCLARSHSFGRFLTNLLWMLDYMSRIELVATNGGSAVELDYLRKRFDLFFAMEKEISHDLNPFSGWLLAQHPHLGDDDMRRPETVARWDVLIDAPIAAPAVKRSSDGIEPNSKRRVASL